MSIMKHYAATVLIATVLMLAGSSVSALGQHGSRGGGSSSGGSRGGGFSSGGSRAGGVSGGFSRPTPSPNRGSVGSGYRTPGIGGYAGSRNVYGDHPYAGSSYTGSTANRQAFRPGALYGNAANYARRGGLSNRADRSRPLYPGAGGDHRRRYRTPYGNGYGYGFAPWPVWIGPEYLGGYDLGSGYSSYGEDSYDNGYGDQAIAPYYPTEGGNGQENYVDSDRDPNAGGNYGPYPEATERPNWQNGPDERYGPEPYPGPGNENYPNQQNGMQYREGHTPGPRLPYSGNGAVSQGMSNNQPPEPETVTLIFKDGRAPEHIHNYLLTSQKLVVLDGLPSAGQTAKRREISVESLDLAATLRVNRLAGVDFRLPYSR